MHLPTQTTFFPAHAAPDGHETAHWGQAALKEHIRRVY